MENKDKIFDQFKNAANNVAPKEFDSMEKVWNRIEDKLDSNSINNQQKSKTKIWKKIAIAASIMFFVSIGYQFFKPKNKTELIENQVVVSEKPVDPTKNIDPIDHQKYPHIDSTINKNIQTQINNQNQVAVVETTSNSKDLLQNAVQDKKDVLTNDEIVIKEINNKKIAEKGSKHFFKPKIYDAVGVRNSYGEFSKNAAADKVNQDITKKQSDLYIIDGEAVLKEKDSKSKIDANDIENIVILKEPLYIINGVQYSEKELFGDNPTSPYAPLDKQEIVKTVIYQDEEAEELYGEKGKKGVVVITTKYGRPMKK